MRVITDKAASSDFVGALEKGLQTLACFGKDRERITITDVARATDVTPASARRSLLTLTAMGYLRHDGKYFVMEPKSLDVAHAYLSSRPIPRLAQPFLDALSERTRESASVGELSQTHVVIVARSTARRSLTAGLGLGSRLPLHCSASGRVLLASLSRLEQKHRLDGASFRALTPKTVTDPARVAQSIDRARDLGFAVCDEEIEMGVRSLAVPLCDRAGATVAAMTLAVKTERSDFDELLGIYLPALRRAKNRLENQLARVG